MTVDLVIRGGRVVGAGGAGVTDIGIADGRVVQLGGELRGASEIDATGRLVLPGGVDVHVHLSTAGPPDPTRQQWVDDFESGSAAAIAGGITTIGNMTFPWPGETLAEALRRDQTSAGGGACIDYILHPVLTDPSTDRLAEIPELSAIGYSSIKVFMVSPAFDAQVDDFIDAIRIAGSNRMTTLVHCEDGAIIRSLCRTLAEAGHTDVRNWAESRPDFTESAATERAIAICRSTGSPIYVVHLSSRAALDACRRARSDGLPISVETRPLYLHLTREALREGDGPKYVGAPPLRSRDDVESIWNGLRDGTIQCLGSDHAPWSLRQKLDPGLDITTARQGVADLDTSLPMLYSEGVRTGRISIERFVEVVSTNPARVFGLYPRKGTIAVGSDADIAVWDTDATRTISGSQLHSRSDYSVYEGWEVQGWPVIVVSRGEVVMENGEITAEPGRGRWLARS